MQMPEPVERPLTFTLAVGVFVIGVATSSALAVLSTALGNGSDLVSNVTSCFIIALVAALLAVILGKVAWRSASV